MFKKRYRIKLKEKFKTGSKISWYKYEMGGILVDTYRRRKSSHFDTKEGAEYLASVIEQDYDYKTEVVFDGYTVVGVCFGQE